MIFNPDYKIYVEDFNFETNGTSAYSAEEVETVLENLPYKLKYKKHYNNNQGDIKVFVENGEVIFDPVSGEGTMRYLQKRRVIFSMNKLHKASIGVVWKWVSDIMAVILLFVGISGLFLLKGKRGFNRWGLWFTIAGIIVPLVFAILYI